MIDVKKYLKLRQQITVIDRIKEKVKNHIKELNKVILTNAIDELEKELNEYMFANSNTYSILINEKNDTLLIECYSKSENNSNLNKEFAISIMSDDLRKCSLGLAELLIDCPMYQLEGLILFMRKASAILSTKAIKPYRNNVIQIKKDIDEGEDNFKILLKLEKEEEKISRLISKMNH